MRGTMLFYMAPMEGMSGYVFRRAYHRRFGDIDRYFTPFIANKKLSSRERNDILPEHNEGMELVPQILANRAEDFVAIAKELQVFGYRRVNLNLGCPSGTVVAKGRGAGFLEFPGRLDAFLANIFEKCPLQISIKTRIGKDLAEEWEELQQVYEKYPLEELIIHPRVQRDFYKNAPNMEVFAQAALTCRHSLCYNGDICTPEDYARFAAAFPQISKVMIGRGIFKNPALVGRIRGQVPAAKEELRAFHQEVLEGYLAVLSGDKNTLFKMKEWWVYLAEAFANPATYSKKIKKATTVREYQAVVESLFREQELVV